VAILIIGMLLWIVTHDLKAYAPAQRATLDARFGVGPAKGVMALAILGSLLLIVWGWRAMGDDPGFVYAPPSWGVHLNNLIMLFAFILLGAGHAKSNLRRVIRHPMLTAAALWAFSHLLANGEARSVILFGGMLLWSVLAMLWINRRDGAWVRPPESPRRKDLVHLGVSFVIFAVVAAIHPWLFGVSPFPG
jgi:uncharacterized membrane protein